MIFDKVRYQVIRVVTRKVGLEDFTVAWLPLFWSNVPIFLNNRVIKIVDQSSIILTASVDITQSNSVILSFIAFIINIVL